MHISKFQAIMRRLYFHRDSQRGVGATYEWLMDEVRELGEALGGESKSALKSEFADVIAWLASLANITNVDLERAAIDKYNRVCPKCDCSPCKCSF